MRLYTWMIRIYFANLPNFPNIMILKFRVLYFFPFDNLVLCFFDAWEVGNIDKLEIISM